MTPNSLRTTAAAERADRLAAVVEMLTSELGNQAVVPAPHVPPDYWTDESLHAAPVRPGALIRPTDADQVATTLALAAQQRVPVTARGSGTGLSGHASPIGTA